MLQLRLHSSTTAYYHPSFQLSDSALTHLWPSLSLRGGGAQPCLSNAISLWKCLILLELSTLHCFLPCGSIPSSSLLRILSFYLLFSFSLSSSQILLESNVRRSPSVSCPPDKSERSQSAAALIPIQRYWSSYLWLLLHWKGGKSSIFYRPVLLLH